MIDAIKPNTKRIILSILSAILTFITFLFARNSKVINEITFKFNYDNFDKVEINEILVNDSHYLSNFDFNKYYSSEEKKYIFDIDEISLNITNNDTLKMDYDEKYANSIKLYSNGKELESTNINKESKGILLDALKEKNIFINILVFVLSLVLNYIIICIISYSIFKIKEKKEIGLLVLLVGLFLNLYMNYYSILNINKLLIIPYLFIILLILLKEIFNFKIDKDNIILAFKTVLIILSISMLYLIPPFNIPDEGNHFTNSYSRLFYLEKDPVKLDENGKQLGSKLFSKNVYKAYFRSDEYEMDNDHKINSISYFEDMTNKINKNDVADIDITYGTYKMKKLAYIPSNIVIWLCKIINTPVLFMFLLARFINLLIGLLLIFKAINLLPKYKYIFMFVIALPLTIHQSIGINQDWINNALFFLYIAYLLNLIYAKKDFTKKDFIILLLIALGIAHAKTVYTPAILLILLVENKKFKKPILTKISLILLVAIITFLSYIGLDNLIHPKVQTVTNNFYTISDFISNPILYFKIIFNTFKSNFMLYTVYGLYTGFGVCKAWIVGAATYLNYIYILYVLSIPYEKDKAINKVFYVIVAGILYLLVNTALIFGWTGRGSTMVLGLHPRYFIPVVLLGFMFINNKYLKLDIKNYEKFSLIIILLFNFLGFLTILRGLYI